MSNFKITVKATLVNSLFTNRGLKNDIISQKTGIDTDEISRLRSVDGEVEQDTLIMLAKLVQKPWTVFLLDDPEKPAGFGHDNRTLNNRRQGLGSEMIKILEDTKFMLDVSKEIDSNYQVSLPVQSISLTNNPQKAGENLRDLLDIDEEQCAKIYDPREMFNYWKDLVQTFGIYVSERALPLGQVRAFSLLSANKAAIVLSTKDSYTARSFSLFHELCHILLRNTGVCDLNAFSSVETERFCNQFSAAFLAPSKILNVLIEKYSSLENTNELAEKIAHDLKMSKVAASIRLNDFGIEVPIDFHFEALKKKKAGPGESGGNYYATAINAAGVKFSKQVFNAVSDGMITNRDAAHFLGVGEKTMSSFKTNLYRYHPDHGTAD
jgi:Zn-dependent peptidase ImmA (M78 family)